MIGTDKQKIEYDKRIAEKWKKEDAKTLANRNKLKNYADIGNKSYPLFLVFSIGDFLGLILAVIGVNLGAIAFGIEVVWVVLSVLFLGCWYGTEIAIDLRRTCPYCYVHVNKKDCYVANITGGYTDYYCNEYHYRKKQELDEKHKELYKRVAEYDG